MNTKQTISSRKIQSMAVVKFTLIYATLSAEFRNKITNLNQSSENILW